MTRQQLRLALGDLRELALKDFGDTGVQRAPWFAQQRAIGTAQARRSRALS